MSGARLLEADAARLASDAGLRASALGFVTEGDLVVLAGDCALLVGALTGVPFAELSDDDSAASVARLVGGTLRVMGKDVGREEHREVLGMMPAAVAMPDDMTPLELLRWEARLATGKRRGSGALAEAALQRVGLMPLAKRRISSLGVAERKGVALAAAIVGEPPALLLDHPLQGLDERGQLWMMRALEELASRHRLLIATPRLATDGSLGAIMGAASDIVVLRHGAVVAHGPPASLLSEASTFAVTVEHGAEALGERLQRMGVALDGGPLHFSVRLKPPHGPSDVLRAAHDTGAVVVACVPLVG
ncbi:MAG TPA: ATP-binding cassette domain-containing protein [Polyangiaceae bacterium]|nr:ATP-binding cassette domain-containing protein [Polyangiaceae bacterium]